MDNYYKDLEKRIELQEMQIQNYCKEIETLEEKLDIRKVVYKVDWTNEDELTFNYSVSETFEGACKNLLNGVNYYKVRRDNELLNDSTHTNDDILTLKYWSINESPLTEYMNKYFGMVLIIDKRGYVTNYNGEEYNKIFCKVRKQRKREKNETT